MQDKVGRINQLTEIDEIHRACNENEIIDGYSNAFGDIEEMFEDYNAVLKDQLEINKHFLERITNIEMLLQEHGIIRKD